MKKFTCLLLTLALTITFPVMAGATQSVILSEETTLTPVVKKFLSDNKIKYNDSSIISIEKIPNIDNSTTKTGKFIEGYLVKVSNQTGTRRTDDITLLYGEVSAVAPKAGQTVTPPDFLPIVTINGTAVYDRYLCSSAHAYRYRPIGVYFYYTLGTGTYVSYINIDFTTEGNVYRKVGTAFESTGQYENGYTIFVGINNPQASWAYSKDSPYPSDLAIAPSNNGGSMYFRTIVDGQDMWATARIF